MLCEPAKPDSERQDDEERGRRRTDDAPHPAVPAHVLRVTRQCCGERRLERRLAQNDRCRVDQVDRGDDDSTDEDDRDDQDGCVAVEVQAEPAAALSAAARRLWRGDCERRLR